MAVLSGRRRAAVGLGEGWGCRNSYNSPLCELNIEAAIIEVAFPLPSPYLSPAMPNTASLVGTELFVQGAFFDGGQTGLPLITTNYLAMTLGAK